MHLIGHVINKSLGSQGHRTLVMVSGVHLLLERAQKCSQLTYILTILAPDYGYRLMDISQPLPGICVLALYNGLS